MLEVVEDQQHVPVPEESNKRLAGRPAAPFTHLQRLRYRRGNEFRIGQRGERYERGAITERGGDLGGDPDGQPCLADAAWSGHCNQAGVAASEEVAEGCDLAPATDERRRRYGEPHEMGPPAKRNEWNRGGLRAVWWKGRHP